MATQTKKQSLFQGPIIRQALVDSVKKLHPLIMMRNPVMFVVEIGTFITLLMILMPKYFGVQNVKKRDVK